ncbi:O-antigen ligase family protein [Desulfomicrobium norvegicum]|nr:O-antigen ligase family protein [Desulfomicrobium norvegicum]
MFLISFIFSIPHSVGCWLVLMLIHGILYNILGSSTQHVPFFAGIGVLFSIIFFRKFSDVNLLLFALLLSLIFLMSVSVFFGINPENSILSFVTYCKSFLLAIVVSIIIRSQKNIELMLNYCLYGLFIGSLFALYQHFMGNYAIDSVYIQRVATLRGDPNDTAMLLVSGLSLTIYALFKRNKILTKLFYFFILLSLVASIVLTHSRGGFIAMIFVSILIFIKKPDIKIAFCLLSLLFLVLFAAPQNYWNRMQTLVSGKDLHQGHSLSSRSQLQFVGLALFMDNPILGVGAGNFGESFARYGTDSSLNIGSKHAASVAHNMYLEFFVENGLFSGLLFLGIFFFAIMSMLKYDRIALFCNSKLDKPFGLGSAYAIALSGLLFSGLFLSQGKNSVLWFMVGIGFSFSSLIKQHSLESKN